MAARPVASTSANPYSIKSSSKLSLLAELKLVTLFPIISVHSAENVASKRKNETKDTSTQSSYSAAPKRAGSVRLSTLLLPFCPLMLRSLHV